MHPRRPNLAPAHFARVVIEYLNAEFPQSWIGPRGNFLEWPARSPDLTLCDFFLWGYVKELVYKEHPQTIEQLQHRITEAMAFVPQKLCQEVCQANFLKRVHLCLREEGAHIENKL